MSINKTTIDSLLISIVHILQHFTLPIDYCFHGRRIYGGLMVEYYSLVMCTQ